MDSSDDEMPEAPAPRPRKKKKKSRPRHADVTDAPATAAREEAQGLTQAYALAGSADEDAGASAARRPLLVAAGGAVLSIALVGTGPSDLGMWIALASGIGLVASIHRLGRLGPP